MSGIGPNSRSFACNVKLTARGACKSMNHAQKYLAQANRQIAELTVQIARQRVIVRHDTG
jgi:hypothetical protein